MVSRFFHILDMQKSQFPSGYWEVILGDLAASQQHYIIAAIEMGNLRGQEISVILEQSNLFHKNTLTEDM